MPALMDRQARDAALIADCSNCAGLCCVALAFVRSADFAVSKPAGDPCLNLDDDDRCRIHPRLRDDGFKGCTVFDCHGAGQKVTQVTFDGGDWRDDADGRSSMFAVFPIVRQLHDMLWYLHTVGAHPRTKPVRKQLDVAYRRVEAFTMQSADDLLTIDIKAVRGEVNPVLARASTLVRSSARPRTARPLARRFHSGAHLVGAGLAGQDLRGADLRGALLIAADLHHADLRGADLIAADLRDADVSGADLSETIFVTQMQVNAAKGDQHTRLPYNVSRPSHWG